MQMQTALINRGLYAPGLKNNVIIQHVQHSTHDHQLITNGVFKDGCEITKILIKSLYFYNYFVPSANCTAHTRRFYHS